MRMPSVALMVTAWGATSAPGSNPAGSMFSSSECAWSFGQITITCGGIRASACMAAVCPSLVITGCHSLPLEFGSLLVGRADPSTGTVQTCR